MTAASASPTLPLDLLLPLMQGRGPMPLAQPPAGGPLSSDPARSIPTAGVFPIFLKGLGAASPAPDAIMPGDIASFTRELLLPVAQSDVLANDASGLPAIAAGGKDSGEDLPESGTDLPLSGIDPLLAQLLGDSGLNMRPAQPVPPVTLSQSAHAWQTAAMSDPALAVLDGSSPSTTDALIISPPEPPASTSAAVGSLREGLQLSATDFPDEFRSLEAPGELPTPDATDALEAAFAPDLKSRIEALLTTAQRPSPAFDPSATISLPGQTSLPGSHASLLSPTVAMPDVFENLPTLRPMHNPQAWADGLGERLLMMADKGMQSATLRLQPESLGPMEIRIRVEADGATQVFFSAHSAQTREALENAIPRLRELFAEQGLNLGQANVDSGHNAFAQRELAEALRVSRDRIDEFSEIPALRTAVQTISYRPAQHRLDVLV